MTHRIGLRIDALCRRSDVSRSFPGASLLNLYIPRCLRLVSRLSCLVVIAMSLSNAPRTNALQSSAPTLELTSVPAFGTSGSIQGVARNASPQQYKIATLLFVSGLGWYSKP